MPRVADRFDAAGHVVRSAADAQPGDALSTRLADGQIKSIVGDRVVSPPPQPPKPRRRRAAADDGPSLF